MRVRVKVPKLGLTVEEVTLSSWVRQPGEAVAADEVIALMESDKASFELTAPTSGTLTDQLCEEGAMVAVGTDVAVISS